METPIAHRNMTTESFTQPLIAKTFGCAGFLCRQKPKILAQYLGSVCILRPLDFEMCGSVIEIYENFQRRQKLGFSSPVYELSVSLNGINLTPKYQKGDELEFKLSNIMCCGVDSHKRKIFVFNYSEEKGNANGREKLTYRTHALQCDTKKSAKYLALSIKELFRSKVNLQSNDS